MARRPRCPWRQGWHPRATTRAATPPPGSVAGSSTADPGIPHQLRQRAGVVEAVQDARDRAHDQLLLPPGAGEVAVEVAADGALAGTRIRQRRMALEGFVGAGRVAFELVVVAGREVDAVDGAVIRVDDGGRDIHGQALQGVDQVHEATEANHREAVDLHAQRGADVLGEPGQGSTIDSAVWQVGLAVEVVHRVDPLDAAAATAVAASAWEEDRVAWHARRGHSPSRRIDGHQQHHVGAFTAGYRSQARTDEEDREAAVLAIADGTAAGRRARAAR